MSDDDLIRRGDVLRVLIGTADIQRGPSTDKQRMIRALPARGEAGSVIVARIDQMFDEAGTVRDKYSIGSPDYIYWSGVREGLRNAYLAARDFFAALAPTDASTQKGGDAHAVDPRHAPHEASPGVTAGADAAHVNETPKSEHDAGNVLTAAQARARFEAEVNADLRGKFTDEELRLAADVLRRFRGQMNGPAEAMSLVKPTDAAQEREAALREAAKVVEEEIRQARQYFPQSVPILRGVSDRILALLSEART